VADSVVRPEFAEYHLGTHVLCELARLQVQARLPVRTRLLYGLGHHHRRTPRPLALDACFLALVVAVTVPFVMVMEIGVRAGRARALSVASGTCVSGGGAGTSGEAAAVDADDAPMLSMFRNTSS
jgi:hypothetical protein